MSDHSFNPFIAKKYNVNVAIFLTSMVFWTRVNASNEHNFYEDRYWTYNTPESMVKYFPYWSPSQIKRIIQKCVDWGLIVKSNWNKKGYDKTNWYALSDKALIDLNLDKTCLKPASELIGRNRPMDKTKSSDGLDEIVRPIPDTNPDTNHSSLNPLTPLKGEKKEKEKLSLDDLTSDNPHNIPEQLLKDWLTTRKSKRAPVTTTAWIRLHATLDKIKKSKGIEPVEAFGEMVANGWQSLKPEYFDKRPNKSAINNNDMNYELNERSEFGF